MLSHCCQLVFLITMEAVSAPRIAFFEKTSLLSLPAELQQNIITYLPYPDLLALKLAHPAFSLYINPTVYDRVDWLLSRPALGLPLPFSAACTFKTDKDFLRNAEVQSILRRRRLHLECENLSGISRGKERQERCLVVDGQICGGAKRRIVGKLRKEMFEKDGRRVLWSRITRRQFARNVLWYLKITGAALVVAAGLILGLWLRSR